MHIVHIIRVDLEPASPCIFFIVANKIIHGGLQRKMRTKKIISTAGE